MIALLVFSLAVAVSANVALVPFMAERLSPQSNGSVATGALVASNQNLQAVTKLAA